MKKFGILFASALALLALASCNDKEDEVTPNEEQGDAYWAALATVTSSDAGFTANSNGGTIQFNIEGGSVTLTIDCGCEWNATSVGGTGWLSLNSTTSSLTVTADPLDDGEGRTAEIVFSTTNAGIEFATVSVVQSGVPFISLSTNILLMSGTADSETVTVESNLDWDYSYDESAGWFSIKKDGNGIVVTVEDYVGTENHESVVTFTAGNSITGTAEAELTIVQTSNALVMTYSITSSNTNVDLPLRGTVDCTVDWGDGTVETITSTRPSHTYAEAGEYDVAISGTVTALYNNITYGEGDQHTPITAVKQWGNTGLTDMRYAFYRCSKLVSLPEYIGDAFADVTTFAYAFWHCSALTTIPVGFFDNCPKVTDLSGVFMDCYYIEEIPEGLFDNCTEVTAFAEIFDDCYSLKAIPKGLFDNCSKVQSFRSLFYSCTAIEEIPAGLFDNCPEVTTFFWVFYGCSSLKSIPAGLFDNCPKVTDFYGSFDNCYNIEEIPAGLFDNCTEVTDFAACFNGWSALKTIPDNLFDNCTKVKQIKAVFQLCTSLTEVPEGLFDNCTEVTDFSYVFAGCENIVKMPTGLFDHNLKVTNFSRALHTLYAVEGESPYTEIEVDGETVKVHLYERADYTSQLGCVAPTSYTQCFTESNFSDMTSIPSEWGGEKSDDGDEGGGDEGGKTPPGAGGDGPDMGDPM